MVNVLDATELEHFKTVKLVNCVIYTVPQFKKKKKVREDHGVVRS